MKRFLAWLFHRHDHEMVFDNPRRPLDYRLICKCGHERGVRKGVEY